MPQRTGTKKALKSKSAEIYQHPESTSPMRPEIGAQAKFKKKKDPQKYRYDDSLAPSLEWDGQNPARERGEAKIAQIEKELAALLDGVAQPPSAVGVAVGVAQPPSAVGVAVGVAQPPSAVSSVTKHLQSAQQALHELKAMSKPFLNWAGKAERMSFEVPTLPLFIHERLSTKAILETLKGHKRDRQTDMFDLFGDPQHSIVDQTLKAYEHQDQWVNRMILGDSLVVMNSLLHYENMGGQVQMIYMDPPYGVKFGSNFQPFVRSKDVEHNDDEDMTREPEMVQAYRDTWELGVHSYLNYLRDRLLLARELLSRSGSIFVQISDENAHLVRNLLDEVFGPKNFISQITFQKTSGFDTETLATLGDFLLWYGRDKDQLKVRKLFEPQETELGEGNATWMLLPDGSYRGVKAAERRGETQLPPAYRLYKPDNILSQGAAPEAQPFVLNGKTYEPKEGSHWKANYPKGMERLVQAGRLHVAKNSLQYRRFAEDFPYKVRGNLWTDTRTGNFTEDKIYVVQTASKVVERCLLLTTDPGDLVLDPTCGSGTTAYVAEQRGRRWITCDTSRVPLALARQRLLTATFDYYQLKDDSRGPGRRLCLQTQAEQQR